MAGGRGTRFWPLSRAKRPKQLLSLFGDRTLLEETLDRIAPLIPSERVLIVTGGALVEPIRRAVGSRVPKANILAEPSARNTSPAIALAAACIRRRDPGAVVAVLPSDHLIAERRRFLRLLRMAAEVARREPKGLVTFGIKPGYAETGYGYIERGRPYDAARHPGVYAVRAFREKPDAPTAQRFLRSGRYYWNSGMFIWSLDSYEANLAEVDPKLLDLYRRVTVSPARGLRAAIERLYREAEATSVDYALLERAREVLVIEAEMGWNDIGSWLSLEKLLPREGDGIYYNCRIISASARNSLAFAPGKLVALLGVSDLIVVDTPDALLVTHRERTQDVKKIVEELQRRGWAQYL